MKTTTRQASRLVTCIIGYGSAFSASAWLVHLETVNRGNRDVLNQGHQATTTVEAFFFASLAATAYDVLINRFYTESELATGKIAPGREGDSLVNKGMPATVRIALLNRGTAIWSVVFLGYLFVIGV